MQNAYFNPTLVQLESLPKPEIKYETTIFQSHIGAIRIWTNKRLCRLLFKFQSHIGAIRIWTNKRLCRLLFKFQSHIGAIRMVFGNRLDVTSPLYFNPTLVQLECNNHHHTHSNPKPFQSHIGAIRIERFDAWWKKQGGFQSHIGAIRIHRCFGCRRSVFLFQSHIGAIRIPLKSPNTILSSWFQSHIGAIRIQYSQTVKDLQLKFQSHIGAIRIMNGSSPMLLREIDFNPTLVQLEYLPATSQVQPSWISIPHWCN